MAKSFKKILAGYREFRQKYAIGDQSVMQGLSRDGQNPEIMVIACCDSRVDPALIFQCEPGDLFVVRNVANIVPPYEKDMMHHGTSAALEFGVCFLEVKHLILLGHSQCGGIQALLSQAKTEKNDFLNSWLSLIQVQNFENYKTYPADQYAKLALQHSYQNCMTFPWLAKKIAEKKLKIDRWFFDIELGQIFAYSEQERAYLALERSAIQDNPEE